MFTVSRIKCFLIRFINTHEPSKKEIDMQIVWALQIENVKHVGSGGDMELIPAVKGFESFVVSREYVEEHRPHGGGYYVAHRGGERSFLPAAAVENGQCLTG